MKKVTIIVQGRVQGVGFRYQTKLVADEIGIVGTVENQIDGSVFIQASASADKVDTFIEALSNNPPRFSRIESMEISEEINLPDFTSFKVIH